MLTADPSPTAHVPPPVTVHPFALRTVAPVAAVVGVVHLVLASRPGWWFDEATTLALGRDHPAWGYADQPLLGPLIAGTADAVAPGSLLVLRLPVVLAGVAAVVLAALVARELGGDRRAQTLTALAQGTTAWGSLTGHWLVPYALEPAVWLVLVWALVRWVRVRHDLLLLVAGVATGAAAGLRVQVALVGVVLLASVVALGPRALLRRPMLWAGVAIAALMALPTLLWQAGAGWPQLRMGAVAAGEADALFGGRPGIAVGLVALAGVLGAGLLVVGLWSLATRPELRDVRFLGLTFIVLAVFFVVTVGRPYYLTGLYGALAAVGAVGLQRRRAAGRRRWRWVAWPAAALSVVVAGAMVNASEPAKGVEPATRITEAAVASYGALSPSDRARTAIVASSYVTAAYVDTYGRTRGLPPAYSPNRSYGYLPAPPDTQDRVLWVGTYPAELRPWFPDVRQVGDAGADTQIWLASGRTASWSTIWPRLRHLDVM